ncbi:MAG: carboxypeptidase-like regulatory domain-containing protein, partial [candidate division KSB1 bacterium]|nr:carboxypeptidase-like regulatory domain-containing protein [candidate division KSB1 bacterium]
MDKTKIIIGTLVFLFCATTSYADSIGEISGIVIDKETKERLSGVELTISGIERQTTTDETGFFHFTGIWPRTYSIRVELSGYRSLIVEDVIVHPEVTTSVNLQLEKAVVPEESEQVLYLPSAQIHNDKVTFWQETTDEEIETLPYPNILEPQLFDVHRYGIEQLVPNLFSVESSVEAVRVVPKEGEEKHRGNLRYQMSDGGLYTFKPLSEPGRNTKELTQQGRPTGLVEWDFNGTFFNKLKYSLTSQILNTDGRFPHETQKLHSHQGRLSYYFSPDHKLTLDGNKYWNDYQTYSHRWKYILDHLPDYRLDKDKLTLSWLHNLSPGMFYEVQISRIYSKLHWNVNERINEDRNGNGILDQGEDLNWNGILDPPGTDLFRDENDNDYIDASEIGPSPEELKAQGKAPRESNWHPWEDVVTGNSQDAQGFYIYDNGTTYSRYRWHNEKQADYFLNARLTFQILDRAKFDDQISIGLAGKYRDIFVHNVDLVSGGNLYGVNLHYFPNSRSFYILNKFNLRKGLLRVLEQGTLQLGVWYELYDPTHGFPRLPESPVSGEADLPHLEKKSDWSPRLGLSFSLSRYDLWYYSYREFQDYWAVFWRPEQFNEIRVHNVGFECKFLKTFKLGVAGFFERLWDRFSRPIYYTTNTYYTDYIRYDQAYYNGLMVSLQKYPCHFISGEVNYVYGVAKGKPTTMRNNYDETWTGNLIPLEEYYMDWDRRHTLSAYLNFHIPRGQNL